MGKTAVMNYVNSKIQKSEKWSAADVAASFRRLLLMCGNNGIHAANENVNKIALAGVASNSILKRNVEAGKANGINIYYPSPILCTDNAAMIMRSILPVFEGNFADIH